MEYKKMHIVKIAVKIIERPYVERKNCKFYQNSFTSNN